MGLLDADYFYDLYCSKRADELTTLKEALDEVCNECGKDYEILSYYCKRHDKDENFKDQVNSLSISEKDKLIESLIMSSYKIFVPWFKELLEEISESKEVQNARPSLSFKAEDLLNYYAKAFNNMEEN